MSKTGFRADCQVGATLTVEGCDCRGRERLLVDSDSLSRPDERCTLRCCVGARFNWALSHSAIINCQLEVELLLEWGEEEIQVC